MNAVVSYFYVPLKTLIYICMILGFFWTLFKNFLYIFSFSLSLFYFQLWVFPSSLFIISLSHFFTFPFVFISQQYSDLSPDFCRDMWLRKSCGLRSQEYGFLWLQRCCCLRQQPTVAASGRKSKGSSQWATPKNGQLILQLIWWWLPP